MAIRNLKPTSPANRHKTFSSFDELTKNAEAPKSLLKEIKKTGGRNAQGKITVRNIGGGNRKKYRIIDFKRNKDGIGAKVDSIQYDPNRTAYIALLTYADGEKKFIIAPRGLNVGDKVMSGAGSEIKPGKWYKMKGSVAFNSRSNDYEFSINDVESYEKKVEKIIDDAPVKRV